MWPWKKKKPKFANGLEQARYELGIDRAEPELYVNVHQMYPDGYEKLKYAPRMYSKEWWTEKLNETMREKEKEMNDIKLTNVKMKKDRWGYYLRLKYIQETDSAISEIIIPKYRLNIWEDKLIISHEPSHTAISSVDANIGMGSKRLQKGLTEHSDIVEVEYSVKVLKEKVHKMTVADIEKKLGYKIEIVSEESEG